MAVFVDTGVWFASTVRQDSDHTAARRFLRSNVEQLVTSDYVVAETLTLFRARRTMDRARDWAEEMGAGLAEIVRVTDEDIAHAQEVFFSFDDKYWSFTDCVSRVMMQRLGIPRAFAFDDHFRQFGTVTVVP